MIVACCQDESGCCVLVEKATLLRVVSQHSSKWRVAAQTREFWQVHEVIPCASWKLEHGEVIAIMM